MNGPKVTSMSAAQELSQSGSKGFSQLAKVEATAQMQESASTEYDFIE